VRVRVRVDRGLIGEREESECRDMRGRATVGRKGSGQRERGGFWGRRGERRKHIQY